MILRGKFSPRRKALLALVLLGEALSLAQWLAIGMIMAASMGCAATAQRRGARPAAAAGTQGPVARAD